MAIGAYGAGIVSIPVADKEFVLPAAPRLPRRSRARNCPVAARRRLCSRGAALVFGLALMRLSGAAASIATLGLLVITVNVLSQATEITAGPRALYGVPEYATFVWVFATLAAVVLMSTLFKWSGSGLRARANRDDVVSAEAVGVGSLRARLLPFVASAFITGIGGGLYGMLLTAFSPASFTIPLVVVVLTMAIIGGVNSVTGACGRRGPRHGAQ